MSQPIPKILRNPLTTKILLILAEHDSYINDLVESLNIKDIKQIIAIIHELVRLGLVVYSEKSEKSREDHPNHVDIYDSETISPDNTILPLSTVLGIPLNEYIRLWNSLDHNFGKKDLGSLNNVQFKIYPPLRNKIKGKSQTELIETLSLLKII